MPISIHSLGNYFSVPEFNPELLISRNRPEVTNLIRFFPGFADELDDVFIGQIFPLEGFLRIFGGFIHHRITINCTVLLWEPGGADSGISE